MDTNDDFREALGEGPEYTDAEIESRLSVSLEKGDRIIRRRRAVVAGGAALLIVAVASTAALANRSSGKKDQVAAATTTSSTSISSTTTQKVTTTVPAPVVPAVQSKTLTGVAAKSKFDWKFTFPQLSGINDQTIENQINQAIRSRLTSDLSKIDNDPTYGPLIKQQQDQNKGYYLYEVTYTVRRLDFDAVTIQFETYADPSGAGNHSTEHLMTFGLSSGKEIKSSDIFAGTSWLTVASQQSRKQLLTKSGYIAMEVDPGTTPSSANFSELFPAGDGLHILFEPYQVAAGAAGPSEVTIPWSFLSKHLTALGQQLSNAPASGQVSCPFVTLDSNGWNQVLDITVKGDWCSSTTSVAEAAFSQHYPTHYSSTGYKCTEGNVTESKPSGTTTRPYTCTASGKVITFNVQVTSVTQ